MKRDLIEANHYHFLGIGGIGMSAIAMALLKKGFSISGSDLIENDQILKIKEMGGVVFNIQKEKNIDTIQKKTSKQNINYCKKLSY